MSLEIEKFEEQLRECCHLEYDKKTGEEIVKSSVGSVLIAFEELQKAKEKKFLNNLLVEFPDVFSKSESFIRKPPQIRSINETLEVLMRYEILEKLKYYEALKLKDNSGSTIVLNTLIEYKIEALAWVIKNK